MPEITPSRDLKAPIDRATLDLTSPIGNPADGFSRLLINLLRDPTDGGLRRIGGWDSPPGANGDLHDQLLSALDAPRPDPIETLEVYAHPSSVTFASGGGFSMSASARGGVAPYGWQWQKFSGSAWQDVIIDGTPSGSQVLILNMSGSTGRSMDVYAADQSSAGLFRAIVTDATGATDTSEPALASILVDDDGGFSAVFVLHPVGQSVTVGDSVALTALAQGTAPITYQWQKYNGTTWDNILAATGTTLDLGSASLLEAGDYRCVATNSFGSDESGVATISVASLPVSYTDQRLEDQTYRCGLVDTRTFTITNPSPSETLTVTWNAASGLCAGTITTPSPTVIAPGATAGRSIQWDLTACNETGEIPDFTMMGNGAFSGVALPIKVYLVGGTSNLCE